MKAFLPFIVAGLATGSLYSIAALGLVLTYRTTGIFNFAHGAVAAGASYTFYELHYQKGLAWPLAVFLCVCVFAPVAGLLLERIARGLAEVSPAGKIVATVGLLLAIQGLVSVIYGYVPITVPQFLPTRGYHVFDVIVGTDQIIAIAIAALAAIGLYGLLRVTRLGLAMRGVVDNPALLDLAGTNPTSVRMLSWMIGSSFAALSGILLLPYLGLYVVLLTLLVVAAFGAAAVGGFASLPLTYLGGLVIGVGAALSTKYAADYPSLSGFPPSFPFLVLFIVLLVGPRDRLRDTRVQKRLATDRQSLPPAVVWGGRAAIVAVLFAVPAFAGTRLPVWTNGVIFILVFVSLRLLVRTSGQVSLCHAAFAAVGGAAFSHLTAGAGLPWFLALFLAGLIAVPVGAVVAVPAIRLSGLALALATFGFAILMERMVYGTSLMFGRLTGFRSAPRPEVGSLAGDKGFYYVCLVTVLLGCVVMFVLNRSRLGRLLRAMADSPVAMITHGTSVNVTRVLVFCISAFLAGVAGALFGSLTGAVSEASFGSFQSLMWLTVFAIAGSGEFSAAVIAAGLLAVVPSYIDSKSFSDWQPVIFGSIAVTSVLAQGGQLPIANWWRRAAERHANRGRCGPVAERWALATNGASTSPAGAVGASEVVRGGAR